MKEPQLNPQVADLAPTGPELTVYDEEHWREVCRIVLRIDPDTRGRPGATSIRKPPLACQMDDRTRLSPFAHCDVAARDLLMPFGDVVMALSIVLRIKRTLNGAEIDELISDVQARKTRAIELARRADWHRRELSARRFQAE